MSFFVRAARMWGARSAVLRTPGQSTAMPKRALASVAESLRNEQKRLMLAARDKALSDDERGGAKASVPAIKAVLGAVKNAQIERGEGACAWGGGGGGGVGSYGVRAAALDDDAVLGVVRTAIKRSAQAKAEFEAADRADLAEKEGRDIALLSKFAAGGSGGGGGGGRRSRAWAQVPAGAAG